MSDEKSLDEQYLEKLLAERAELDTVIAAVQRKVGKEVTVPQGTSFFSHPAGSKSANIQHDTFYGMTVVNAAKKYLGMVGKPARSTQEIMDALKKGGVESNYSTTSGVLARAARKGEGIENASRGHWGLSEWYPGGAKKKKNRGGSTEGSDDANTGGEEKEKTETK